MDPFSLFIAFDNVSKTGNSPETIVQQMTSYKLIL